MMDIVPAWSPDGEEIAFARSPWDGEWRGTQLMTVPADGSNEPAELLVVDPEMPFAVYFGMAYAPDGETLYYTIGLPDLAAPDNGVWRLSLGDGTTEKLAGRAGPERGYPTVQEVSPLGDQILTYDALFASRFGGLGSAYALLDLQNGDIEPLLASEDPGAGRTSVDQFTPQRATYSPDGRWLVFSRRGIQVEAFGGITIRPAENAGYDADTELVPAGVISARFPTVTFTWATNGTLFVQTGVDGGFVLTVEDGNDAPEVPAAAVAATPGATPASALGSGPVDPGTVVAGVPLVVNETSAGLRSAPSVDAPVVADLAQGTAVTAIGPPETAGGFTWIPVRDDSTGTIGFVRAELVSAA